MNRAIFYDHVRRTPFPSKLTQPQVDGINVILDEWDRRGLTEASWLAYMLATTFHETARWMQPVIETRQAIEATNPSVDEAIRRLDRSFAAGRLPWVKTPYWRKDADGFSWLGRGFVQLTFKTNYANGEKRTGLPLTKHPELMLTPGPACKVMYDGMINGWFTGKKLGDYLSNGKRDFLNARRIINGVESADLVAGHASDFLDAVLAAA